MATILLTYAVKPGLMGLTGSATAKVFNAVAEQPGELDILGMVIVDNEASINGDVIDRKITLQTTALGDELYPTPAALKDATRNLWTTTLSKSIPASVSAAEPVVS